MLLSPLADFFARLNHRRKSRKVQSSYRPQLETLEDRVCPSTLYDSIVLANGPIADYKLNDASGPAMKDSSNVPPGTGTGTNGGVYGPAGVTYGVAGPIAGAAGDTGITLAGGMGLQATNEGYATIFGPSTQGLTDPFSFPVSGGGYTAYTASFGTWFKTSAPNFLGSYGNAFSADQLGLAANWAKTSGNVQAVGTWQDTNGNVNTVTLGPTNLKDDITSQGQKITLPAGQVAAYSALDFLAMNTTSNGATYGVKVTYTDGNSYTVTTPQMTNWVNAPKGYAGETTVVTGQYLDHSGGAGYNNVHIYGYSLALSTLDPGKNVASITLPNNGNFRVFGMSLDTAATSSPVDLSTNFNEVGIVTDASSWTGGVILGQTSLYDKSGSFVTPGDNNLGGYVPAVYVGSDGRLYAEMFWHGGSNQQVVSGQVNDGNWHFLMDTYTNGVETLYLDGMPIGSQDREQGSYFTFTNPSGYEYFLGTGATNGWNASRGTGGDSWDYFKGSLSQTAIYSQALTPQQVLAEYQAGVSKDNYLGVSVANPGPVVTGGSTTYTITVTNPEAVAVAGTVNDVFSAANFAGDSWTATATGGATGFSASGTGTINDSVAMPAGSSITYIVTAQVSSTAAGKLTDSATTTVSGGGTNSDMATNTLATASSQVAYVANPGQGPNNAYTTYVANEFAVPSNTATSVANASSTAKGTTGKIYVASTAGFPASGTLDIQGPAEGSMLVNYTGTGVDAKGAYFTGLTGGSAAFTLYVGNTVALASGASPPGIPVEVTTLGAYDNGGFKSASTTVTVSIYDTSSLTAPLATQTFTQANPGTQIGGSTFQALATPLILQPGHQYIEMASGYNNTDRFVSSNNPPWTTNGNGGLITFTGVSYHSTSPTSIFSSLDGGPANVYLAGTFQYQPDLASNLKITDTVNPTASGQGGTVTYTVTVTNNGTASANAVSVTDPFSAGLSATSGNGQVALSWTAITGAAGYDIYRGTTSGGEVKVDTNITSNFFTDTGLTNGIAYYYKITPTATTNYSNEASATPQAYTTPSTSLVTAVTGTGGVRTDGPYLIGGEITVGGSAITVTQLGRIMVSGDTLTHTIELVQVSGNTVVASTVVNMAGGTPGQFTYASLATPVTLQPGQSYYLVDTEGVDPWYDQNVSETTTSAASLIRAVWSNNGGSSWNNANGGSVMYVGLDLKYGQPESPGAPLSATVAGFAGDTWTAAYSAGSSGPANGSGTLDTFVNLAAGGTATFTITAKLANSNPPNPLNTTATANAPGMTPTNLQSSSGLNTSGTQGEVYLSWSPVNPSLSSSPVTYNLYRGTQSGGETLLASGLTNNTYTDLSGTPGTTYYYYVTAVYANLAIPPSTVTTYETAPTNEVSGNPPKPTSLVPGLLAQFYNLNPSITSANGSLTSAFSVHWQPSNLVASATVATVNDNYYGYPNTPSTQTTNPMAPNYLPAVTAYWDNSGGGTLQPQSFDVQFIGYLKVPVTGTYKFALGSDDGSLLYLGGYPNSSNYATNLIINENQYQGVPNPFPTSGNINLTAGTMVPIDVLYFGGPGGPNGVFLDWQPPAGVPSSSPTYGISAPWESITIGNFYSSAGPAIALPAQPATVPLGWAPQAVAATAPVAVGYPPTTVTVSMVGSSPVIAGKTDEFIVTVTNAGPNTAYYVNLQDVLPSQFTFLADKEYTTGGTYISSSTSPNPTLGALYFTKNDPAVGSTGTITDSIYSLPANTTLVFKWDVTVKTNTAPGTIPNSVVASGDNFKANTTATTSNNIDAGSSSPYANFDKDPLYTAATSFTTTKAIDTSGLTDPNPAPQGVYQTENDSTGVLNYTLSGLSNLSGLSTTPGGLYSVRLDFAELQPYGATVGDGVFDVAINGKTVLTNFDIGAAAGGLDKAIDKSFLTSASGGNITITLTPKGVSGTGTAFAEINGIQVSPAATVNTTITNTAHVTVTKTAAAAGDAAGTVDPGNLLVYTVTVANNDPSAPSDALTVAVADPLPANETFVKDTVSGYGAGSSTYNWTATDPAKWSNGTITETIPDLPWGQTATFTWTVQVGLSPTSGTITNSAAATATDSVTSTSTATTTINNPADNLTVTKTGPKSAQPGQNITYTVTITNTGNNPAFGVDLHDPIPQPTKGNITVVSDSGAPGWTSNSVGGSQTFDDTIAELLPGAANAATFTWVVAVGNAVPQGYVLKNIATGSATGVNGSTIQGPRLNATGEQDTKITSPPTTLTFTSKTGTPGSVVAGAAGTAGNVNYTLVVTNSGTNSAFDTVVTDPLPKGETYVSSTVPTVNWTATTATTAGGITTVTFTDAANDPFAASAADTFTIVANVPASTPAGTLKNTATVTAGNLATAGNTLTSPTVSTTVTNQATLGVGKTVTSATVTAGNLVTYNLSLTTVGPSDAFGTALTDPLPKNFTVSSFTAPAGWFGTTSGPTGGGVTTVKFAPTAGNVNAAVAPGTLSGFQIVAKVPPSMVAGSYGNVATATASDAASASNAPVNVKVSDKAVLSLVKSVATSGAIYPGNNLTYSLVLTNAGPSDAFGTTITDVLPTGESFVAINGTLPTGWTDTVAGQTVTFTDSNPMAPGTSGNLSFKVLLAPSFTGTSISNSATAAASDAATATSNTVTNAVNPAQSSLVVTMSAPTGAAPDKNLVYTVTVQNTGPSDAKGATLSVPIPLTSGSVSTTFVSDILPSPTAGWAFVSSTGGVVKFADADFAPSSTASTFTITVMVPNTATNGSTITNTATVGANNSGAGGTPGTVTSNPPTVTTISNQSSLTVTLAAAATAAPGTNLVYTVTIQNAGPTDAFNTLLSIPVPAVSDGTKTTFVSVGALPAGWTETLPTVGSTGGVVKFSDPDLAPSGSPTTFTFTVGVPANATNGSTITNDATGGADNSGSGGNPGTVTSGNINTTVAAVANLTVKMSAAPNPVLAGNQLTYTATVQNSGPNDAANAILSVPVPTGTSFVSVGALPANWVETDSLTAGATTGNLTFKDTDLVPNTSPLPTFTMVFQVPSSAVSGSTITDAATASAADAVSVTSGNVTTTVNTQTDLTVTKTAVAYVNPGSNLTYNIGITNTGPSDAQGVVLTDPIPTGLTFVSDTLPAGWTETDPGVGNNGTVTFTDTNPLTANSPAAAFTIVVNVPASTVFYTQFTNKVTATSTTPTSASSTLSASATTTAAPVADLILTKSGPTAVVPGQTFTYTVTLNNTGPNAATSASVSDPLPAGATFVSDSPLPAGWTETDPGVGNNGTVTFSNPSFGVTTATFTITVTTSQYIFSPVTLSNTASATATDSQVPVVTSNTLVTNVTPSANAQFVNSVYEKLLGRAPDPSALFWVNQLNAGMAPSTFVQDVEQSGEYLNDLVSGLYYRYLNRAPDAGGLQTFVSQLASGVPIAQVTAEILGSQEFYLDTGGTNTSFITALYQDLLNRTPSAAELNSWLTFLNAGLVRNGNSPTIAASLRTQIALDFLTSTEYEGDLVNSYYLNYLYRSADLAGLNYWTSQLQSGLSDQTVLAAIFGSAEGYTKNS